ncbi:ABC transporter ATP-binding protein [Bradyrhizobium sp. SRS-191]|uniref:ABC transporter ATP-binding protein n=1 Tax=Bradyrhizobium sp. SRS-191 TaxID=2962606 RepID=UPI00211F1C03|nr:ABC transporter ATP-binding protein [Bradyrhizobium sp. SRS-191]
MNQMTSRFAPSAAACAVPAIAFDKIRLDLGGKCVVDDLSFSVAPGEFACVVGPSGCGKTTLLRLVTGLLSPTRGTVHRLGAFVGGPSPDVAIVFQDYGRALLPWRTAAGNVALALEAMGTPRLERAARAAALLDKVGLAGHGDKYPAQMSGGMQQRVQIARCLAQEPRILLMDEPFGALDALTRQALQDEIAMLVRDSGATALFVTHDLDEAIYLGDRVFALQANPGRLAQVIDVALPRPRDQLGTREQPEFLRLRHVLFDHVQNTH